MIELIKAGALMLSGIIALRSGLLAYHLWKGDSYAYEENRLRSGSFNAALRGHVPTVYEGRRDYKVAAGIAFDRKTRKWVDQGRLSDEAISAVLKR